MNQVLDLLRTALETTDEALILNNKPLLAVFCSEFTKRLEEHGRHKTHLMLQNCDLESSQLALLADVFTHMRVERLNISRNLLDYECAPAIARLLAACPALIDFDMRLVGVVDEHAVAKHVLAHPSLASFNRVPIASLLNNDAYFVRLDLDSTEIGGQGGLVLAHFLRRNTTVLDINLRQNSLSSSAVRAISDALYHNHTLTSLNLAHNTIGARGMECFAQALRQNTGLMSLNISWNAIGARGANALATAVSMNQTLTSLDVAGNNIGNEGMASFARALMKNRTLSSIDLSVNSIGGFSTSTPVAGYNDFLQMSTMLKENTSLVKLSLQSNTITDTIMLQIAEGLAYNTCLKILSLDWNPFGDGGLSALAYCLRRQQSLEHLSVAACKLTRDGVLDLTFALRFNTTLKSCDISDNNVGLHGMLALTNVVRQKKTFTALSMGSCRAWGASSHQPAMEQLLVCIMHTPGSLTNLVLRENAISAELGQVLLQLGGIPNSVLFTLNTLDLSGNPLHANAASGLAFLLKNSVALHTLSLRATELGSRGVEVIATGLGENMSLISLDLEKSFDDTLVPLTTAAIMLGVTSHPRLQRLSLIGNHIGDSGSVLIAAMLEENSVLTHLRLDCNNFDKVAARQLSSSIPLNTTLRVIKLDSNPLCCNDNRHMIFKSISSNLSLVHISAKPLPPDVTEHLDGFADAAELEAAHNVAVEFRVTMKLVVRKLMASIGLPIGPVHHMLHHLYSSIPLSSSTLVPSA